MPTNPIKVDKVVRLPGGDAAQVLTGTGTRVNATATTPGSAGAAIPTGSSGLLFMVKCSDSVWLRWGTSAGMTVAAADTNSDLIVGGECIRAAPVGTTHFSVLRVGAADVAVQLESIATT